MKLTEVKKEVLENRFRGWTDLDQTIEDFLRMDIPVAECDISTYRNAHSARASIMTAIQRNRHDGVVKARVRGNKVYLCNEKLLQKEDEE